MKKLLGMLLFLVVSLLIMVILYKNGLFAGINGSALLGIFLTVASLLLVLFIWFAFDNSTRRGLFFILNKKNYLQTMAIIRKERLTNISYNGSESGYGGYRQRQYKIDYQDKQGNRHEKIYITGMAESKFATLLHWKVGTSLRVVYSPKKPGRVFIDKAYDQKQVKRKMSEDKKKFQLHITNKK